MYNFEFNEAGYDSNEVIVFNFGEVGVTYYYVLKGSENITSIWADLSAGPNSGKFYAASSSTLNIVDIENRYLYDWYTQTHIGRAEESLDSNNIVDINKGR